MINRVQEIVSDQPTNDIWKRIRYLTDQHLVTELITTKHNIPKGKYEADIRKQAKQIGYSIIQAEEYYSASKRVNLPTRPVLLYYGSVCLSKALILLSKTGEYSYDSLRNNNKHQHHGLELSRNILSDINTSTSIEHFLRSITCKIFCKNDGTPWGHFPLFIESLSPPVFQYQKDIRFDSGGTTGLKLLSLLNGPPSSPLTELCKKQICLFDSIRVLPDLYFTLQEIGITPGIARGSANQLENRIHNTDSEGNKTLTKMIQTWNFMVDGIKEEEKESLLSFLKIKNPNIKLVTDYGHNIHMQLIVELSSTEPIPSIYYPDIIEDTQSRLYYLLNPESHIDEPATLLIIQFCLGMIARYYPDIWMKCTQENIRLAEFIDTPSSTMKCNT